MSYKEATNRIDRLSDSMNRMQILLDHLPSQTSHRRKLTYSDWLRLLGEHWIGCDRVSQYANELRDILPTGPIRLLMTAEENQAYDALPVIVPVYRGGDARYRPGVCWSQRKEIAHRFLHNPRFSAEQPTLYHAHVRKSRILAVKLERGEHEIITFHAQVDKAEPIVVSDRDAGFSGLGSELTPSFATICE